ncbi:MAG: hypothetical protein HYT22_03550 [Candidatus Niyogibacteria bacterium]|nr:hypothetical protein [Candidatus Niyogibacteria bacterium]
MSRKPRKTPPSPEVISPRIRIPMPPPQKWHSTRKGRRGYRRQENGRVRRQAEQAAHSVKSSDFDTEEESIIRESKP